MGRNIERNFVRIASAGVLITVGLTLDASCSQNTPTDAQRIVLEQNTPEAKELRLKQSREYAQAMLDRIVVPEVRGSMWHGYHMSSQSAKTKVNAGHLESSFQETWGIGPRDRVAEQTQVSAIVRNYGNGDIVYGGLSFRLPQHAGYPKSESDLRKVVESLLVVQQESLQPLVDPRNGRFAGLAGSIVDSSGKKIAISVRENIITANFLPTVTSSPRRPT